MIPRLIGLGLVAAILTLAPFTHASPPDQTWIAGFYDNADFDDVVLFITAASVRSSQAWNGHRPSWPRPPASCCRPTGPVNRFVASPSAPVARLRSPDIPLAV